jgi:hypothetical protein
MIYRGFNEVELGKIIDILDKYEVNYNVSVPESSINFINDKSKRVDHRFMDNLLQIEIEKVEFEKIKSPSDINKLFDLRIYVEESSPFTEDELNEINSDEKSLEVKTPDKHAKLNQMAAILAVSIMTILFLMKKGVF